MAIIKTKMGSRVAGILVGLGVVVIMGAVWADVFEIRAREDSRLLTKLGIIKPSLPEPTMDNLSAVVVPEDGFTVDIVWGEVGKKLVEAGAIDMEKYKKNYSEEKWQELLTYLTESKEEGVRIDSSNSYFWVNTLWALGLTQNSKVLTEGIMGTEYEDQIGNFASTGGWTMGAKDAVSLYSSSNILDLDENEQTRVEKITAGIYRPCCGNPTSFPDCNHGMAILGLVELMVDQGFLDEEIYKAALAFNSYWFPQTYIDLAYYFQTTEGILWQDVDAKKVLSAEFSSAPGYQAIKLSIDNVPGAPISGGSCGA